MSENGPALTVLITVGPEPSHTRWLGEALESLIVQTYPPAELLIIDDMAGLQNVTLTWQQQPIPVQHWHNAWRLGFAASFNIGMGLAHSPLIVHLDSDDRLAPHALADCAKAWLSDPDPLGYYWLDVEYSSGERQSSPCNAAMIPRSLWRHTGGFPLVAAAGRPDWMFIEAALRHGSRFARLIHVQSAAPPYWVRLHPEQDTVRSLSRHTELLALREQYVREWAPPAWTARVGEAE